MDSHLAIALFAAFCIGLSKSGFSGVSLISIFLMADLYGAKASVGLTLPLLIFADLLAYPAFRKHGSWAPVWKLLPPTLLGIAIGWFLLGRIPDVTLRRIIGCCILLMAIVQVASKLWPAISKRIVDTPSFSLGTGVLGGFATMMANAAGPVIKLYLLARHFPKLDLIGISARFFLLINLLKLPLNANLNLITPASLRENLMLAPGVALGILGGRWLVHRVPQKLFEWLVTTFALIAAARLLFF